MSDRSELVYMDHKRVKRTIKRMAYQISEDNREDRDICLIGVEHRGYVVASFLRDFLTDIYDRDFPLFQLDSKNELSEKGIAPEEIKKSYPLVVDDVIFSGKTMFTALNTIYEFVSFEEIHTAVLVDRGHRTFPIQAQFVGLELATKLKEHVSVQIQNEDVENVVLEIG